MVKYQKQSKFVVLIVDMKIFHSAEKSFLPLKGGIICYWNLFMQQLECANCQFFDIPWGKKFLRQEIFTKDIFAFHKNFMPSNEEEEQTIFETFDD